MTRLPALKAKQVIKALRKAGFVEVRQVGSHRFFKHPMDARLTHLPLHGGQNVKHGTLGQIIKQAGLSEEEFFGFLK